jgi:metallophosphoesterase (TIGR03767 family)
MTIPADVPWRTELASEPDGDGATVASICHLSDLHVMDVASPMRFEWIETLADDPRWRPLLHLHRPQESLVPWALAAHVDAIGLNPTTLSGRQFDLVLSTGDNIDNAQRNELDAYLALISGGTAALSTSGGPQDAEGWEGPGPWPYWSPLAACDDTWKPRGYPVIDDLLERTSQPIVSSGVGLPWTSMPGNHDLLCQGTAFVDDELRRVAIGGEKALFPPTGFAPDDPLSLFVDEPAQFIGHGTRALAADPMRRDITVAEWVEAHAQAGAAGWSKAERAAWGIAGVSRGDAVIDLGDVVVIVVDTNHPYGDYQGSVGSEQLDWLDHCLTTVDADGRLAVLASHHGPASLVNHRGEDPQRRLAESVVETVHRHPSAVLWLTGHRHVHRITPWPGAAGGFWEITTGSIIDWPSERRSIELRRHGRHRVEIVTTVHGHHAPIGSLAGWHLDLARRFSGSQVRGATMAGTGLDRNVRLSLAR